MAIARACAELRKLVDSVDNGRVFHVEQGVAGGQIPVASGDVPRGTSRSKGIPSPYYVIYWNQHVTEILPVNS
jgi:hypothetical protein